MQAPKPPASSFARESYFGLTAMRFINKDGVSRYGRYRILPEAGNDHLDAAAAAAKGPNYLFDEIEHADRQGASQVSGGGSIGRGRGYGGRCDRSWPESRKLLELGSLSFTEPVPDEAHEQKQIIFDPIPRVDGIEASDDPLLELRAAVYLLSGRRRRAAPE